MSHLKGDETPEEKAAHIGYLRKFTNKPMAAKYPTAAKLPRWVKQAIQLHDVCGMTWKQVCQAVPTVKNGKKQPRNPGSLKAFLPTPGARAWREALKEVIDDPSVAAKMLVKHDSPHLLWMTYQHLEACKLANDLGEYGRTLRQLHDIAELTTAKNTQQGPTIVQINVGNGQTFSTELPMGESSAEKIVDAEIVDE